jgi:hypothetical protein
VWHNKQQNSAKLPRQNHTLAGTGSVAINNEGVAGMHTSDDSCRLAGFVNIAGNAFTKNNEDMLHVIEFDEKIVFWPQGCSRKWKILSIQLQARSPCTRNDATNWPIPQGSDTPIDRELQSSTFFAPFWFLHAHWFFGRTGVGRF